jgi:hypothetical protein
MPGPSPLVGYNTNVRHKGRLYHIQTEDSGVNHPHVITHLFADGGRIIASRKTGYTEHLGAKDLQPIVKKLMQDQHKAIFIELRDCVYDDEDVASSAPMAAPLAPALAPQPTAQAAQVQQTDTSPRAAIAVPAPRFVGTPPPPSPLPERGARQQMLDADALDRAAEARLLGSTVGRARAEAVRRGAGRYQQTVPANPNRAARPQPGHSIFGGEALRGKSLDEVILSYLSDDAGEGER